MGWFLDVRRDSAARRQLTSLRELLGDAGLRATGAMPGLLAEVDQHAAAVRDILRLSNAQVAPVDLAAYARGVWDVAHDAGWRPPERGDIGTWSTADWTSLRLLAVCLLAASGLTGITVADGDADPLLFT